MKKLTVTVDIPDRVYMRDNFDFERIIAAYAQAGVNMFIEERLCDLGDAEAGERYREFCRGYKLLKDHKISTNLFNRRPPEDILENESKYENKPKS